MGRGERVSRARGKSLPWVRPGCLCRWLDLPRDLVLLTARRIVRIPIDHSWIAARSEIAVTGLGRDPAFADRGTARARIDGERGVSSDVQHCESPLADVADDACSARSEPIGRGNARALRGRVDEVQDDLVGRSSGAGQAVAGAATCSPYSCGGGQPGFARRHSTMIVLIVRWQVPQPSPAPQASVTCWRVRAPSSMLARTVFSETPWHRQTTMRHQYGN